MMNCTGKASVRGARPFTSVQPARPYLRTRILRASSGNEQGNAVSTSEPASGTPPPQPALAKDPLADRPKAKRQAESTDAVATFLTRRFGIAGGLAWLGFLAIGTLGEQIKTRMEVAEVENGTKDVVDAPEVVLPSGVSYRDLRVGGGSTPIKGYLAVVDYVGKANGEVFEDTKSRGKPIVYFYKGRPFTAGLCAGVEEAIATMKAGGRRIIKVPASSGFGEAGTILRPTEHVQNKSGVIPGNADLEYDLELVRVSIPPS